MAASVPLLLTWGPLEGRPRHLARSSTIEANRFVPRDTRGATRGVMEVKESGLAWIGIGDDLGQEAPRGNHLVLGIVPGLGPQCNLHAADRRSSLLAPPGLALTRSGTLQALLSQEEKGDSRLVLTENGVPSFSLPPAPAARRGR